MVFIWGDIMIVTFYRTDSAPNVVNKNLVQVGATLPAVYPYGDLDIMRPELLLPFSADLVNNANYFYIQDFDKYYMYSQPPTMTDGQRIVIHGVEDVLQTHAANLVNCPVSVIRSESEGSNNVIDTKYPLDGSRFWFDGMTATTNKIFYNYDATGQAQAAQIIVRVIST